MKKDPRKRARKRLVVMWLFLLNLCLLTFWLLFQSFADQSTLDVTFYQVSSQKVQQPVRTVLLSDLHLNEFGEENEVLIERVRSLTPDFISIVGDMNLVENPDYSPVIRLCEKLCEIAPVYYVYGNHELPVALKENSTIERELTDAGAVVLRNRWVNVEVNGNALTIGGLIEAPINFEKWGREYYEGFLEENQDRFKVLLVHYPEYFAETLLDDPLDLVLSGHAHGGQVRIPAIGGLYTPDQGFLPDLTEGVHALTEGGSLVISRGLGNSGSIPRVNNNPELVVVDIGWR